VVSRDFLRVRSSSVFLPVTPKILLGQGRSRRKRGNMHEILKDFAQDMLRQLFGWGKPREVRLMLTRHAVHKMHEYQLDVDTLKDVFRYGERTGEKITRQYANYAVGLYYKYDEAQQKFVITTCWKGGV
jgi:hypothetical protein